MIEEIERYNVLADEIRKLGAKLEQREPIDDLINRERYTALLNWCEALSRGQDRIEAFLQRETLISGRKTGKTVPRPRKRKR